MTTLAPAPLISQRLVPVMTPGGDLTDYTVGRLSTGLGAIVIPRVLFRGIRFIGLVEIDRPAVGTRSLEFPRGTTSDLDEAEAARELLEETGIDTSALRRLGTLHTDTGALDNTVGVWCCPTSPQVDDRNTWTRQHEGFTDPETGSTFRWLSEAEFLGRVVAGEITCGLTLAAWALYLAQPGLR